MHKKLYVAYGSNLNIRQMHQRCPGAKLWGTGVIDDHELQFRGQPQGAFATIVPKAGCCVPVAVWEIGKQDEQALDRYEGYPSHYFKEQVNVRLGSREVSAMVYRMNLKMGFGLPSPWYYATVQEGYRHCGLNTNYLAQALRESAAQYYDACRQASPWQMLPEEDEAPETFDLEDVALSEDEQDPFYFSEGMRL